MDLRLELVYRPLGPGSRRIPLADTDDRELLYLFKRQVLKEAARLVAKGAAVNHIVGALYELDEARVEGLLNILLPDEDAP